MCMLGVCIYVFINFVFMCMLSAGIYIYIFINFVFMCMLGVGIYMFISIQNDFYKYIKD